MPTDIMLSRIGGSSFRAVSYCEERASPSLAPDRGATPRAMKPGRATPKGNVRNPQSRAPCIDGAIEMPRLVLIDTATGARVRHRIRSWKQALKQQEWYETKLGRRVRIEKVFER
ncbi:hypothetical protein [Methanoculleus chikugoensis]|uniref:Uncharacterized protein n=1 Tax=Methanoculleus chikugoensis TaxID=118126 RepID=A0ABM7H8Q2_9EURY|nr:hypothetical protein [Methanoculleus chikugoensis]BBL69224.1 hypothetical protein MchiMG62_24050 [Methanoculleus chikugoensis]